MDSIDVYLWSEWLKAINKKELNFLYNLLSDEITKEVFYNISKEKKYSWLKYPHIFVSGVSHGKD